MATSPDQPQPELSRRLILASVPESGESFRIEATEEERRALARRFDLIDLPSLRAEGVLTVTDHGRKARLEGELRADVVQSCVVTLDPVPATVEERFVRIYSAEAGGEASAAVDIDAEDPPEPIVGGAIDVGEVVAETLGLGLDPYPRAPGAELQAGEGLGEGAAAAPGNRRESPFAALKGLIKKA
jgi:uncharacterized metal-binding protein YceD (DUF177 family)